MLVCRVIWWAHFSQTCYGVFCFGCRWLKFKLPTVPFFNFCHLSLINGILYFENTGSTKLILFTKSLSETKVHSIHISRPGLLWTAWWRPTPVLTQPEIERPVTCWSQQKKDHRACVFPKSKAKFKVITNLYQLSSTCLPSLIDKFLLVNYNNVVAVDICRCFSVCRSCCWSFALPWFHLKFKVIILK